ncbi:MAG: hypothetical protein HY243_06425 [Proteobacteria bacterium]|nr:hypothetical protein [Pseudomonadota bacterium]
MPGPSALFWRKGLRLRGPLAVFISLLVAAVAVVLLAMFAVTIFVFVAVAFVVAGIASFFFPRLRLRRTYTMWKDRSAPIDGTFHVVDPPSQTLPPHE